MFFQFSADEGRLIEERRRPELRWGLALQIGFLRVLLDAVRMVPRLLWRHLGERFGVAAPDLASLRAMYRLGGPRLAAVQDCTSGASFARSVHGRIYMLASHGEFHATPGPRSAFASEIPDRNHWKQKKLSGPRRVPLELYTVISPLPVLATYTLPD